MTPQDIQKLRDLPIEAVAERLGLRVSHHKCLCPFHNDSNPSLSFNVRKNTARCFVCMNESYGTIDLVMHRLGIGFKEACQWLANENNIILAEYKPHETLKPAETQRPFDATRYIRFFEHPYLSPAARQFLFEERKLNPNVIGWCRITSWKDREGNEWLQTPYFDGNWKLIGVQNRNLKKGANPRFRFVSGMQPSVYNMQAIGYLRPGDELYICEGCSDCWSMMSAGHNAIAIPSATLLNRRDVEQIRSIVEKHDVRLKMYPDHDVPGEGLFLQLKEIFPQLEHMRLPAGCKDYSDYYVNGVQPLREQLAKGLTTR